MNTAGHTVAILAALAAFTAAARAQVPATTPASPAPVPPAPPPPLVDIRNLTVRDLRVAYVQIDSAQEARVEATGAEPQGRSGLRRFLDHGLFQSREDDLWDKDAWPGNAWIVEARTRRVIWELRVAAGTRSGNGLLSYAGPVHLTPGVYELYYASLFPVSQSWDLPHDWRVRATKPGQLDDLRGPYLDDDGYRRFQLRLWAAGERITAEAAAAARNQLVALAVAPRPGEPARLGFEVARTVRVEAYGVGQRVDGRWQDFASIRRLDTGREVWSFRDGSSRAAGGAAINREARDTLTLSPGRYVATYVSDDAHHPGGWDETPPRDPASWGLTVRVLAPADRSAIRSFEYQPVAGTPIVQLTRLRDDEFRYQRFVILQPLVVHIFALGEGSGQTLVDRAWLVDSTGRAVWRLEANNSRPAGGAAKNRLFDGTMALAPGGYTAYAVTDGSHSAGGGWNAAPPLDGEYWGLTIAPADGRASLAGVARAVAAAPTADVLARIDQVGDRADERARFHLAADGPVRITALGEGTGGDMDDYGWIEDAAGQTVWRMRYDDTEPAGGSSKNRRADAVVRLRAGEYTARYRSDASHSFGDWNAAMPDDPLRWGITVTRVR